MNENWLREIFREQGLILRATSIPDITATGLILNAKDRAGAECARCEEVVRRELERIGGGK